MISWFGLSGSGAGSTCSTSLWFWYCLLNAKSQQFTAEGKLYLIPDSFKNNDLKKKSPLKGTHINTMKDFKYSEIKIFL